MPATPGQTLEVKGVEGRDSDAARNAHRDATASALRAGRVTMSTTPNRAQAGEARKPDSLRSLRAGAVWGALPARDQQLLLWLMAGDIVTAQLASLLVYGPLRIAQRRLGRLVEIGLLRGFWTAGAQRPHGRYAYMLTRSARLEIERLQWPEGRPDRPAELPASAPVHQLATHDMFAAFLRVGNPELSEGIFAWLPERACGQLFGFLRADALAGIRVGDRTLTMFIERDLGTERGEVLAEKVRRYRSVFARAPEAPVAVGFVVESARRASTINSLASRYATAGLSFLTIVAERVRADPLGARWFDGESDHSIRDLASDRMSGEQEVLTSGCLLDPEAMPALDDRGAAMLPSLAPYLRS
jgi:hypothetical protein